MQELKQQGEKWFSCGCREWRYLPEEDETGESAIGDKHLIHSCSKIKVYQGKSLSRVFVRCKN